MPRLGGVKHSGVPGSGYVALRPVPLVELNDEAHSYCDDFSRFPRFAARGAGRGPLVRRRRRRLRSFPRAVLCQPCAAASRARSRSPACYEGALPGAGAAPRRAPRRGCTHGRRLGLQQARSAVPCSPVHAPSPARHHSSLLPACLLPREGRGLRRRPLAALASPRRPLFSLMREGSHGGHIGLLWAHFDS